MKTIMFLVIPLRGDMMRFRRGEISAGCSFYRAHQSAFSGVPCHRGGTEGPDKCPGRCYWSREEMVIRRCRCFLCTHDPIDIFVIMLGTNDVKRKFRNSAIEIAKALEMNIQLVQAPQFWGGVDAPKILIVCPPGVTADYVGDTMEGYFDEGLWRCRSSFPKPTGKLQKPVDVST